MMMMIKRWAPVIFALLLPLSAGAQDDDFGLWYTANVKAGVTQKLNAEVSLELRTFENAGKVDQGFFEAGLEYKLIDYLSVAGSYRLTDELEDDSKYYLQHHFIVDLKGSLKPGNFTLQGRFRFQTRIRTYLVEVEDQYPDYAGRIRLKATYRTQSFPVNPYLYSEIFIPLNKEPERVIGKVRFAGGIEYRIFKKHSIDLSYILQRDYMPDIYNKHIIQIGYNFSF